MSKTWGVIFNAIEISLGINLFTSTSKAVISKLHLKHNRNDKFCPREKEWEGPSWNFAKLAAIRHPAIPQLCPFSRQIGLKIPSKAHSQIMIESQIMTERFSNGAKHATAVDDRVVSCLFCCSLRGRFGDFFCRLFWVNQSIQRSVVLATSGTFGQKSLISNA